MNGLTGEQKNRIDRVLEEAIRKAFEAIYSQIESHTDIPPSEIARHLDVYWDLGVFYQEWWEADGVGTWH